MSISIIERMVDALINDEMNMIRSMSLDEMDDYVYILVREKFENMTEQHITEEYERLA